MSLSSGTRPTFFYSGAAVDSSPLPPPVLLQSVVLSPAPLLGSPRTSAGWGAGLDDGVPVKVVLDVICWHAMHLEVSRRYHVLLVHLCVVSWGEGREASESRVGNRAEPGVGGDFRRSPVMVGPAVLIGGMWGYPGGPIMDMLCLESM